MTGWRQHRSPLLAAMALIAVAAVLVAPTTRWIAWRQLRMVTVSRLASGPFADDSYYPIADRQVARGIARAVAQNPADADLQAAAVWIAVDRGDRRMPMDANGFPHVDEDVERRHAATKINRLRALVARFPDRPSLRAAIVCESERIVNPNFRATLGRALYADAGARLSPPDKRDVEAFIADATAGQRLEPDNCFFTFMRSAGLLCARKDTEAIRALTEAAAKPRYDSHRSDLTLGASRMWRAAFDDRSAMLDLFAYVGLGEGAQLRALARAMVSVAVDAEGRGRVEQGIAVRRSLWRCASLLRVQGTSTLDAIVARGLCGIALDGPAVRGERRARAGSTNTSSPSTPADRRRLNVERMCAYLATHGFPRDARWLRDELAAEDRSVAIINRAVDEEISTRRYAALAVVWLSGSLLLAGAIWTVLLGAVCGIAARVPAIRQGKCLADPARWGGGLAVGAVCIAAVEFSAAVIAAHAMGPGAPWDVLLAPDQAALVVHYSVGLRAAYGAAAAVIAAVVAQRRRGWLAGLAATAVVAGTAIVVADPAGAALTALATIACAVGGVPRRIRVVPLLQAAVVFALVVIGAGALLCGAGWLSGSDRLAEMAMFRHSWMSYVDRYEDAIPYAVCSVISLSAPLALACTLAVIGWLRRVPCSVAIVRGSRSAAVPIACVLSIAWAGAVVRTVQPESEAGARFDRLIAHEGRYCAAQLGETWPGPVR